MNDEHKLICYCLGLWYKNISMSGMSYTLKCGISFILTYSDGLAATIIKWKEVIPV